ncbi:MAG: hypothetical protein NTY19_15930 [Planctomycetota bacterium]|nr:hypothetical protein [Planctomycetota bacterium]
MSDCLPAEIWIGVSVAASLVPDLCAAITEECIMLDWDEAAFQPKNVQDLKASLRENNHAALNPLREQLPGSLSPLEPFEIEAPEEMRRDGHPAADAGGDTGDWTHLTGRPVPRWIGNIDWALLRRQKTWLEFQPLQYADEAEGLLALLDSLQDYAVDDLGLPAAQVFPGHNVPSDDGEVSSP